jgi:thiol-disulfide isomerase/thioredoxin
VAVRALGAAALALLFVALSPAQAGEGPQLGVFVPSATPAPAPEISFGDAAGNSLSLADFAGKIVLVNLWATWCGPCLREMPSLERLQQRFGDRITILAISEDRGGSKAVAPFVAKLGVKSVKIYLDPKSTVGRALKVEGLPTSFLIDRQGRILGRVDGEAEWDSPKMVGVIEPFLDADAVIKTSAPPAHP